MYCFWKYSLPGSLPSMMLSVIRPHPVIQLEEWVRLVWGTLTPSSSSQKNGSASSWERGVRIGKSMSEAWCSKDRKTPASPAHPTPRSWSDWQVGGLCVDAMRSPWRSPKVDNFIFLFYTLAKGMLFSSSFFLKDFFLGFDFPHNWCDNIWRSLCESWGPEKMDREAARRSFLGLKLTWSKESDPCFSLALGRIHWNLGQKPNNKNRPCLHLSEKMWIFWCAVKPILILREPHDSCHKKQTSVLSLCHRP